MESATPARRPWVCSSSRTARSRAGTTTLSPGPSPLYRMTAVTSLPATIDETSELLRRGGYVADRALATSLFLALKLKRPLFLEGEAGVGKTEIAKVLS